MVVKPAVAEPQRPLAVQNQTTDKRFGIKSAILHQAILFIKTEMFGLKTPKFS